jgi:hypothetical protein
MRHLEMDFQVDLVVVHLLTGHQEILVELLELPHRDQEEMQEALALELQTLVVVEVPVKWDKLADLEQVGLVDMGFVVILQVQIIQ